MPEIINGMWKFKGTKRPYPSVIYLQDDEIIGAIVDDEYTLNPQLILLTLHSGPINIDWHEHHEEIVNYIEGGEEDGE